VTRVLACQSCGRTFTPVRRSDAKTCSSPCRQCAYRQRLKEHETAARQWWLHQALKLRCQGEVSPADALLLVVAPSPKLRRRSLEAVRPRADVVQLKRKPRAPDAIAA
jgi:DNA-directed RNA polymerase subunit RPC12/RpoP